MKNQAKRTYKFASWVILGLGLTQIHTASAMTVEDPTLWAKVIAQTEQAAAQASAYLASQASIMAGQIQQTATQIQAMEILNTKSDQIKIQTDEIKRQSDVQGTIIDHNIDSIKQFQPSARDCSDIANARISGAGRAGGGRSAARMTQNIDSNRQATVNPTDALNQTLDQKAKNPDLCDTKDGQRSSSRGFSCSAMGTKANSNLKVGSLFQAAGTGTTVAVNPTTGAPLDATKAQPSYSIDGVDKGITTSSISNIVSAVPPTDLPAQAENTGAGRAYLALNSKYTARLNVASEALAFLASFAFVPEKDTQAIIDQNANDSWASKSGKYAAIYGSSHAFPKRPSPKEIMAFSILEPTTADYAKEISGMNTEKSIQELIRRVNLSTQLQWQQYQQNEYLVALEATRLAQEMEPITQKQLMDSKAAALSKQ